MARQKPSYLSAIILPALIRRLNGSSTSCSPSLIGGEHTLANRRHIRIDRSRGRKRRVTLSAFRMPKRDAAHADAEACHARDTIPLDGYVQAASLRLPTIDPPRGRSTRRIPEDLPRAAAGSATSGSLPALPAMNRSWTRQSRSERNSSQRDRNGPTFRSRA